MTEGEKISFYKLVKHFGVERANQLHTEFMQETKAQAVKAMMDDKGFFHYNEEQPDLFRDFVNTKIEEK